MSLRVRLEPDEETRADKGCSQLNPGHIIKSGEEQTFALKL